MIKKIPHKFDTFIEKYKHELEKVQSDIERLTRHLGEELKDVQNAVEEQVLDVVLVKYEEDSENTKKRLLKF